MEPYLRRFRCFGNVWGFNTLVRRCLGVLGWIVFGLRLMMLFYHWYTDSLILRDSKGNVFILDLDDVAELILFIRRPSICHELIGILKTKTATYRSWNILPPDPVAMENEDSLVIHVKFLQVTLSGWSPHETSAGWKACFPSGGTIRE